MALLALPILLILQTPAQQVPKATIEGVVMRVGTNEPVARARVSVTKLAGPGAAPAQFNPSAIPPVMTDSQGRFIIADLEPGSYQLSAARNGFELWPGRVSVPANLTTATIDGATFSPTDDTNRELRIDGDWAYASIRP